MGGALQEKKSKPPHEPRDHDPHDGTRVKRTNHPLIEYFRLADPST